MLTNEAETPRSQAEGKPKPNPFYLTLIVGDKLLYNSMIDSGASTNVILKQIAEVLNIKYEPLSRGVMQLDGNKVQTTGLIKSIPLTLFACPSVSVSQEVIVIDIPPIFGLCLSHNFTTKIGGYLSLDWSHLILQTQHGAKLKILLEPLLTEHIVDQAMINFEPTHTSISNELRKNVELLEDEEVTDDITLEQEVFLNEFINSDPYANYHAIGLSTYFIFDEDLIIPKLTKEPLTKEELSSALWTLHFDGARCKVGSSAGICLTSPSGEQVLRSLCS